MIVKTHDMGVSASKPSVGGAGKGTPPTRQERRPTKAQAICYHFGNRRTRKEKTMRKKKRTERQAYCFTQMAMKGVDINSKAFCEAARNAGLAMVKFRDMSEWGHVPEVVFVPQKEWDAAIRKYEASKAIGMCYPEYDLVCLARRWYNGARFYVPSERTRREWQ